MSIDTDQQHSRGFTVDMLREWLKKRKALLSWRTNCVERAHKIVGADGLLTREHLVDLLTEGVADDFIRTAYPPAEIPLPEGDIHVGALLASRQQPQHIVA